MLLSCIDRKIFGTKTVSDILGHLVYLYYKSVSFRIPDTLYSFGPSNHRKCGGLNANQIWCRHLVKHIEATENVQRKATKQLP